jgi:starch phosphorylase
MAGKANAVSHLHGEIVPREWPGFSVESVTNGVHAPTWLGSAMRRVLDEYVSDWQSDAPSWERLRSVPDGALWGAHEEQKRGFIQYVNSAQTDVTLRDDVLTLVWARRFAEYKRPGLLVSDLGRLARLMSTEARPVQLVLSGKAHPRDEGAKRVMQGLLQMLRSDDRIRCNIAFIPDYRIGVARELTAGADVWVNTPRKPLEASGTSGMKASDNGVLQLTVRDGWAAEVNWWETGWGITGGDDAEDAEDMYHFLEKSVVPTYYDRDESGVPVHWVRMMKNTMIVSLQGYSARRMLLEYLQKLYLPSIEEQGAQRVPAGT